MRRFSYARTVFAIAHKDAVVELRSRESTVGALIFALLVVATFAFALELPPVTARAVAPGLLWVTLGFAGMLSFGRLFGAERDRGTLDGLLLAPVDASAVYAGKLLGALLVMILVLIVALPAFTVLLGVPLLSPQIVPIALLGLLGFAAAGTLFAALALSGRSRDALLPILFLPVAIPVILTATGATGLAMQGASTGGASGILVACDALYLATAFLLFQYALEE